MFKLFSTSLLYKPRTVVFALAFISILSLASIASAAGRGRIEGSVTDPSGDKIVGARVTLRDRAGVISYQTRTDGEGQFKISDVVAGRYTVTVEATGFTQSNEINVEVRQGATEAVAARLDVAAISDQVIITATRTATQASELGGSVSVITSEDLTRANQIIVSESLRLVPGLSVAQTGGRGGITSIFTRGGESDYNKVLIDGVPVNRAGGGFDFAFLTTENVERIEVVRGSQSALFGSDAMTSAIQFITHRGSTSTPEFELSGEGGSFASHRETARLSGLARWFDYSTSFGYYKTDGRFTNSDYLNRSASANLGFQLAPSADLRITSRWNNSTLGVPGPTAILFADDQRQKHHDLSLAATLNLKTTSRIHQTARFIYSELDTNSFDRNAQDLTQPDTPPLPPGSFVDSILTFIDHEKRRGVHYQAVAAINNSNLLTAGIDFEHEAAVFTSVDAFSSSRVSPDRNNLGLYVQDQTAFGERVFITAGVRIEHNTGSVPEDLRRVLESLGSSVPSGDIGFGWNANPKIAVSLLAHRHSARAVGATRFKASFGTGIKEPTLDEAFGPSLFALGNPGLDPERNISFDAGVAQEFFDRRLSLELTYYDNRFRDLITFASTTTFGPIQLPNGVLTNFINTDRASGRGIELIASARPAGPLSRLHLTGSYTYLRSRLDRAADILDFPPPTFEPVLVPNPELGLPLLRRPKHSGTFYVSWIDKRFDLVFDGSLVGRRRDFIPFPFAKFDLSGRPVFNDGYAKLNGSGSVHVSRFLTLFARVENLLNQDYQEIIGFPAYHLNFSAGLRVRIGGGR